PVLAGATVGGLARRVPQASMHPEMRQAPGGPGPADSPFPASTRSPAELRAMLSKFQAGQARARAELPDGDNEGRR
ncbi:MAG: hypothetical protein H0W25_15970, partial [Acidimicrobiia bacterium]|nr:hypothetical protein [Acidimicrobiia bacterium]